MKKLLLLSCCLTSFNVFASCNFYLNSYVNIESGSVKVTKYDEVYEKYREQSLSMSGVNINSYGFTSYGKNISCSSGIYQGNQLFSLLFTPYCSNSINSSDLTKINDGEYYTQKCTNNLSLEILKKYDDALVDISILPTGFHAVSFSSYTAENAESSIIAFKIKNLVQPKNVNIGTLRPTLKDGYYRFDDGYGGYQAFLYDGTSHKNALIDVYLAQNHDYLKLGSCNILMDKDNKLSIKCFTETSSKTYKLVSQYNSITLIDPTSNN